MDGYHIDWMSFGKNKEWAEQVFRCIKQCWDEAKCVEGTLKGNTNNASSTSFWDESKKVKELGLGKVNYVRCNYRRYCGIDL